MSDSRRARVEALILAHSTYTGVLCDGCGHEASTHPERATHLTDMLAEHFGGVSELAKLGLSFKSDTLFIHFIAMCGLADDHVGAAEANQRRVETAERMDELAERLELSNG